MNQDNPGIAAKSDAGHISRDAMTRAIDDNAVSAFAIAMQHSDVGKPLDVDAIRSRWNISPDDLDWLAVARRLDRAWRDWSDDVRWRLVFAVEAIRRAETLKRDRDQEERCLQLAAEVVRLANGAVDLHERLSPVAGSTVSHMVEQLAGFAICALEETSRLDYRVAARVACSMVEDLRVLAAREIPYGLIGELWWLADGKRSIHPPAESTIRRYGRGRGKRQPLAAKSWRQNWRFIRAAARLTSHSERARDVFRCEVRAFLGVADPSIH
jgi:hypothetical protein